jgi:hypothetical protein
VPTAELDPLRRPTPVADGTEGARVGDGTH